MDKFQALAVFWSSFGVPAYDENTVPDDAALPYITYEVAVGSIGETQVMTCSIWDKSNSWEWISQKTDEISEYLGFGGVQLSYGQGSLWIKKGSPFAQRMSEPNDRTIRRMILNIEAEFLSAY